MKKMSKIKLTYITPVLDFVQAESEGQLLGTVSGSGGDTETNPEGDWNTPDKDSNFQFDDSDADFFYLD